MPLDPEEGTQEAPSDPADDKQEAPSANETREASSDREDEA